MKLSFDEPTRNFRNPSAMHSTSDRRVHWKGSRPKRPSEGKIAAKHDPKCRRNQIPIIKRLLIAIVDIMLLDVVVKYFIFTVRVDEHDEHPQLAGTMLKKQSTVQ
jgi:hypothetical protein